MERGTTMWKINIYRSRIMGELKEDLKELPLGFKVEDEPKACGFVKEVFKDLRSGVEDLDDKAFLKRYALNSVYEMERVYRLWNDIDGISPENIGERKKCILKLNSHIDKVRSVITEHQFEMQNQFDDKLPDLLFNPIKSLVENYSNYFPKLKRAYNSYVRGLN